ncbi:hypothetical protein, variant 1 [Aphanomyces invadans]|uniref:RING-CH-type domain-containing protein n=1 Tax=Aphanomyces invadans TaxID=157072 RepID=A0A024U8T4_9STRA|nr:hypothetical protein, variant 1 [Aphanomyces invadans]ETW02689.1 hypothetical protein, variant 1 [Aphanomyces invadans]|eukprot:XP_008869294.1 hypothetical protein, variant 1 [Aphanomyces invadans]
MNPVRSPRPLEWHPNGGLGPPNMLISACLCMGSVGRIHTQCLKAWILSRGLPMQEAMACELCKTTYRLVGRRRIAWGRKHAFSNSALVYATAFVLLLSCTVGVLWTVGTILSSWQTFRGSVANLVPLIALLGTSVPVALLTLWQLFSRWRAKSSVVYFDTVLGS